MHAFMQRENTRVDMINIILKKQPYKLIIFRF